MEWIIGAIIVFAALMMSNFGKDPTKKTGPQLEQLETLHLKRMRHVQPGTSQYEKADKEYKVVKNEIERRKKMVDEAITLEASNCRKMVLEGYMEGWNKGKALNKNDKQCHETAMVSLLYKGIEYYEGKKLPTNSEITQVFCLEMIPFNLVEIEKGKEAIIEYAVWKNFPELANKDLISDVVKEAKAHILKSDGGDEFLKSQKEKMAWGVFL